MRLLRRIGLWRQPPRERSDSEPSGEVGLEQARELLEHVRCRSESIRPVVRSLSTERTQNFFSHRLSELFRQQR